MAELAGVWAGGEGGGRREGKEGWGGGEVLAKRIYHQCQRLGV